MKVYFSLGTNLGNRNELLEQAITLLNKRIGDLYSRSSFYETEPWGFTSIHPFLNACTCHHTELSPQQVLQVTQKIEKELGRTQKSKNKVYHDRPMDIDILLFEDYVINTPTLTIPHPLMAKRQFVLEPLKEIAPDVMHPVLNLTISQLFDQL